jgi:Uma2 family endonuclease
MMTESPAPPRLHWGKYRAKVLDNFDLLQLGRLLVEVPSIPGEVLDWALPNSPYAGPQVGFFALPPIGANVWVEFEGGNPNFPIWTGCFWEEGQMPVVPATPDKKVWRTEFITIELDDTPGEGGLSVTVLPPLAPDILTMTFNAEGITMKVPPNSWQMSPEQIEIEGNVEINGIPVKPRRKVAEPAPTRVSYDQYLAAEASSEVKHEWLRGEVFAMAGGTPEHARLAAAIIVALSRVLADRPCEVFTSHLRVRVEATDLSTYSDVTVVCGTLQQSEIDVDAVINPTLIVEVLSESTEGYDRGEKFAHFRRLPSLREYVLVSSTEPRLEAYSRNDAGEWVLHEAGPGESLSLRSIEGARLETDVIYRNRLAG